MKILHTSDWHIGRALYGRKRHEEYDRFFDWLIDCLRLEKVDVLLLAGDVFDNGTPGNRSLEQYYRFLCRVPGTGCRHIVITAGNHDSPSLLNAPREVLSYLNVHVVGCITDELSDEVLLLKDADGRPQLIVCAVPYLRDRDIRRAEAGESCEDKGRKLLEGIRDHYQQIGELALAKSAEAGMKMPILAMGHLFTSGGQTVDGDGVRELYVGNLGQVRADIFPDCFDYLALGHLHVAQTVGGAEQRRYCGSPIPMGFGEAGQDKIVLLAEISGDELAVKKISVPTFQVLLTIRGDWQQIAVRIAALKEDGGSIWLEVIYDGEELIGDLQERLRELVDGSALEILRTKNLRLAERALNRMNCNETLDDLEPLEVFTRCLQANEVPNEQQGELLAVFHETVAALHDDEALGRP